MNDDFERWTRQLVADAVSAAPPPPELGDGPMPERAARSRPRIVIALVGAAAATVAAVAVGIGRGDGPVREDVHATVATDPAAPTTVAPDPSPNSPPDTTTASIVPPSTNSPDSTGEVTDTSVAPVVPPATPAPVVVTAGPDGVWVIRGEQREQWVTEPMARAVLTTEGLIVQRPAIDDPAQAGPLDDQVLRTTSPGGALEPFLAGLDWGDVARHLVLHDATTIAGSLRIVIEAVAPLQATPESPSSRLFLVAVSDGGTEVSEVAGVDLGWEAGVGRLRIGGNGLIVGESYLEASGGYLARSVGPVSPPTAATLGLEEAYFDCGTCPRLYTVSDDGTTIAWLDESELVRFDLASGQERPRVDVGQLALRASGLDITDGQLILESFLPDEPAVRVDLITGEVKSLTAAATSASFGPDALTTTFEAAPEFPDGMRVDELNLDANAAPGGMAIGLLNVVGSTLIPSPQDCPEAPGSVTLLDVDTLRLRTGCDDSVAGVDYRVVDVALVDGVLSGQVLRRYVCIRGVAIGGDVPLCV